MNYDDEYEIDPEYGVFGDPGGISKGFPLYAPISDRDKQLREAYAKKKADERQVSEQFNRYMIDVFNAGRK